MNNDNNTSNNTGSGNDDEKTRFRQEANVLADFMTVTQRRVEQLRMTMGTEFELADGEKNVLQNLHTSGMMEGTIAGISCFVLLRRGPKAFARFINRRRLQKQQQQQHHPGAPEGMIHPQTSSPFQQQTAAEAEQAQPTSGILFRTFQITVDALVSMTVAAYVSYWQMDREKIMQTVTDIPLMEGRSRISDALCSDLVKEYQRQWKFDPDAAAQTVDSSASNNITDGEEQDGFSLQQEKEQKRLSLSPKADNGKPPLPPFDRKDILLHPQIKVLEGYVKFIRNCQRRQALEQRIRQEQGLPKDAPVSIPFPGVSVTMEQSSVWMEGDGANDDGAFYVPSSDGGNDSGDWAQPDPSSFVTDQEDSQK